MTTRIWIVVTMISSSLSTAAMCQEATDASARYKALKCPPPTLGTTWTILEHDGANREVDPYLSSLGQGETGIGTIASPLFKVDTDTIRFTICGHDGRDGKRGENYIALVDAREGKALRKNAAPGNDALQERTWDVAEFKGVEVRIEVCDGIPDGAFAWLGIGSIDAGAALRVDFRNGLPDGWNRTEREADVRNEFITGAVPFQRNASVYSLIPAKGEVELPCGFSAQRVFLLGCTVPSGTPLTYYGAVEFHYHSGSVDIFPLIYGFTLDGQGKLLSPSKAMYLGRSSDPFQYTLALAPANEVIDMIRLVASPTRGPIPQITAITCETQDKNERLLPLPKEQPSLEDTAWIASRTISTTSPERHAIEQEVRKAHKLSDAEAGTQIHFKLHQLDTAFRSEGVAVADMNGDGKVDIVAGNVYYAGPDWKMQPRACTTYGMLAFSSRNRSNVIHTSQGMLNMRCLPMLRRSYVFLGSVFVSELLIVASVAAQEGTNIVVEPRDNGRALVNPDMGWTMHFYSNIITNYGSKLEPSDTLDDFPGLSTVYLRLPWSFLEPTEGQYDWSVIDTPAQRWISKGKRVAFRISCCESWMRYATPEWVQRAGAKGNNFTVGKGIDPNGPFWEPVYDDPVFLDKLERFLAVFSKRYDGNPHVAFIDVGSYGVWGEGHCWASTKLETDDAVKQRHIDLYVKYFPHTLLAVSDDFIGPGNRVAQHPLTDYMLTQGVTLRDDSICVQPPPNSWFHAELAQSFWPKLPVVLEHEHYGASVNRNAWGDGSLLLQSVEEYHASYMSIHWWPHEFLEKNRDIIDRINRRLGYRLQLKKLSWPGQITLGQPFTVEATWANAGVAPCYPGGYAAITFKDQQGGIVSVHVFDELDLRELGVGAPDQAPTRDVGATFTMARVYSDGPRTFARAARGGMYDVYVSVGTLDGTPRIALPLDQEDSQRRYRVGSIQVLSP